MENLFDKSGLEKTIARINNLTNETQPGWGKMSVSQMMAHCCVAYEMFYEKDKFKDPNFFMKMIVKLLAKNQVVGSKPYPKNGRTAPEFIISDQRDFETEKKRLLDYLTTSAEHGAHYFDGKQSISFGALSSTEWNTLYSKHLDHHLRQFGV